ncbi:MAG: alpha/beta hydrolase family esterase [Gemmobacter sp.]
MSRVTDLTRAGKLDEATALIQSLLQGGPASAIEPAGTDAAPADGDLIEGSFTRLETPVAARSRPKVRRGLSDTLRNIAAGGMPGPGRRAPLPVDLPEGARFLSLTHGGAQGRRDYRLYVPARRTEGRMPLVVMLHGCTQSPEDFATGTGMNALAEEFGFLVAWPAQPTGANAQKCWNWFRPEDQGRDRGEPALLAGIVRDILRDHPADAARVYVAGLSAGGAAAAIMGAAYPEMFAAVGVHSGLPVGGARDVASAFAAMRGGSAGAAHPVAVPTIVFHGLADATVHPGNGAAVVAQAMAPGSGLRQVRASGRSQGGRSYSQTRHLDAADKSIAEHWEIAVAAHAWAGGHPGGSYTDPAGPDASREMIRFFMQHRQD